MKSFLISIFVSLLFISCNNEENTDRAVTEEAVPNTLTEQEMSEGWTLLFDGVSTEHWRGYNMEGFPDEGWVVEDGALVFHPVEGQDWTGLDIITREKYGDFEFKAEWMISEGGNSGIFHHVVEQPGQAIFWSAPEMQLLDNDAYPESNDTQLAGSLYDLKPAVPQNTKPHGEWNSIKIVSSGPNMQYWQNGELVVEFERWTAEWYDMVRGTKFECHPAFGNAPEGHIGLQDHTDLVRFRNLKIRKH